jgi:rhamnulokinase
MSSPKKILAFDLGAESGRGLLGLFDGSRLQLREIHRFPNGGVRTLDSLHWDVLRLHNDILNGLRLCATTHGGVDSVGVDTWGVDFALLGRDGSLLGNPRHHRDPYTEGVMEAAFQRVERTELYRRTGIQFMRFNSLIQLLALQRQGSPLLDVADKLLFIPDLFHYFLTGEKVNEYTDASTSQLLDPVKRDYDRDLVRNFGLPDRILGTIVPPGTVLGPLRRTVAEQVGLSGVPVVLPATHDTAAAVAAVPARGDSWAYISSGTWSLMGVEIPAPRTDEAALAANFTNEGGVDGTIRLLKNIMGLWLVQECRRTWERAGQPHAYDELMRLAMEAPPFVSVIDPDDASFILPASMPDAVSRFCQSTGQTEPNDHGATIRCVLESLALRYSWGLSKLEQLTGRRIDVLHIVGGGCQNALLCQLTADACNRPVLAGPVEATAIGNVLIQALGLKLLGSLAEAREVVRASFDVVTYEPRDPAAWGAAHAKFRELLKRGVCEQELG